MNIIETRFVLNIVKTDGKWPTGSLYEKTKNLKKTYFKALLKKTEGTFVIKTICAYSDSVFVFYDFDQKIPKIGFFRFFVFF